MSSAWERIFRGLGVFTVAGFLVSALTPASNALGRKLAVRETIQPADAIVVLAAGAENEILGEESLRRLLRGIELYKQGLAPLLIVDGPCWTRCGATEAELRARLARRMDVPPDAIIKEERAGTTREESAYVSVLLQKRNMNRILLVTDATHMRRAQQVFQHAGVNVSPAISSEYPATVISISDRLWLTMRIAEEATALVYYRLAGYI